MPWIILGSALIIAALAVWRADRRAYAGRRAGVWPVQFGGWSWRCGAVGRDGCHSRAAAILAAERAGYWVAPDAEGR